MKEALIRFIVKHPWFTAAAVAAAVGVIATLIVLSGVVPIKASSGHWWITATLLDVAKMRAVSTSSLGIQPPSLDDASLVLRGAAHYEIGCAPCHGSPATSVPPVMAAMTPAPPPLTSESIGRFTSQGLFVIVKHGIKFTGMPAWPAQTRDDEVWAIVAFLRRMPTLDAAEYRQLAYGSTDPASAGVARTSGGEVPRPVRELCWRCHAVDGTGRGDGAFPSLAGQRSEYLYASLRAFGDRTRFSGIMNAVAANLDDASMRGVARYYEALPPRSPSPPADARAGTGTAIAARGIPSRDVPACVECHGPTDLPKNPAYPRLASQRAPYLSAQLHLLQQRRRGGSANVNLMHAFVDRLSDEDIRNVAQHYASTTPESRSAPPQSQSP